MTSPPDKSSENPSEEVGNIMNVVQRPDDGEVPRPSEPDHDSSQPNKSDPDHPDKASSTPADAEKSGAEAARYRRKLRDAEATISEREERISQLESHLSNLQRDEAERIAGEFLTDPSDFWKDGLDLPSLQDDAGNLSPEKVTAAAESVASAHPHWKREEIHVPTRKPVEQLRTTNDDREPVSWHSALNPRR